AARRRSPPAAHGDRGRPTCRPWPAGWRPSPRSWRWPCTNRRPATVEARPRLPTRPAAVGRALSAPREREPPTPQPAASCPSLLFGAQTVGLGGPTPSRRRSWVELEPKDQPDKEAW